MLWNHRGLRDGAGTGVSDHVASDGDAGCTAARPCAGGDGLAELSQTLNTAEQVLRKKRIVQLQGGLARASLADKTRFA